MERNPISTFNGVGAVRGPRRTRVLVVEDEAIVAMDLAAELEQMGYDVVGTAGTAADALRLAELSPPDVALLDIRLQGSSDGIDVAAVLVGCLRIPIIYLTADADQATLDRALRTSPAGYLTKPIGGATLRTTIEVALRNSETAFAQHRRQQEEQSALRRRSGELVALTESLREQCMTDALTGLYNRRHFDTALARELQLADRHGHPVGLLLLDIDNFKKLNDTLGHPAGDAALVAVAAALRARLRGYDIPCRIGGDELAVIVPGAELPAATELAEQLRRTIEGLRLVDGARPLGPLSVSVGVAAYPVHGSDRKSLLSSADQALYVAKRAGRDRVMSLPPPAIVGRGPQAH
jgi:diguanylate cyclase (GGDEF)-like protein